jgi:hypothetical protein
MDSAVAPLPVEVSVAGRVEGCWPGVHIIWQSSFSAAVLPDSFTRLFNRRSRLVEGVHRWLLGWIRITNSVHKANQKFLKNRPRCEPQ